MPYKNTDHIYVRTNYRGFITPLGTSGPVVIPVKVTVGDAMKMVMSGLDIYEVDPATKNSVKLSISNILDDTKFQRKPSDPVRVATKVTTTTGINPPVRPTTPPPLVSAPIAGTPDSGISTLEETDEEHPVETVEEVKKTEAERPGNALIGEVTNNGQHLSKSQRRKLRQQQAQQGNGSTETESEDTEEDSE